jgi:phosphinothricin acetyltransferase
MHIRPFKVNDCEAILNIYSYYVEHTAVSFEYEVPKLSEFKNRLISISKNFPFLVCESDNELIGYAYANRFRERKAYDFIVESSVYVHDAAKQKGIGSQLYKSLFSELKKMKIKEVIGVVTLPNNESAKFHENQGFVNAGTIKRAGFKFEKWWDIRFYQKSI